MFNKNIKPIQWQLSKKHWNELHGFMEPSQVLQFDNDGGILGKYLPNNWLLT